MLFGTASVSYSTTVEIDSQNNQIWGREWPAGVTVTLTIDDPGTPGPVNYTDSQIASSDIIWAAYNIHFNMNLVAFQLKPGQIVTLSDQTTNKTHTITSLVVTSSDDDTDIVSGTAATGSTVQVSQWADDCPGGVSRWEIADVGGNWAANFAVTGDEPGEDICDITPGTPIWVSQTDADGDATAIYWSTCNPQFNVQFSNNQVWSSQWAEGTTVTLTVDDPVTPAYPDYSDSMPVDVNDDPNKWERCGKTSAFFDLGDVFVMRPGHSVTVTDGDALKDHIVEDVVVNDIDIAGSTVSGTAEPSAELRVIVWSTPNHDSLTVSADGAGSWAVDFSSIYQFTEATSGAVFQCDVDDDCTVVQWRIPSRITVDPQNNQIWGREWPAGDPVKLTIEDPDTPASPDHTDSQIASAGDIWAFNNVHFNMNLVPFQLEPDQIVTLQSGAITKTLTVTHLTVASSDADTDTVTGTAVQGSIVQVSQWADDCPGGVSRWETADVGGNWAANFAVTGDEPGEVICDITPGTPIWVSQTDAGGDATAIFWSTCNPRFNVEFSNNQVWSSQWAEGTTITLTVDDPGTSANPDYSDSMPVDVNDDPNNWEHCGKTSAFFDLGGVFTMQPGHSLTVTDGDALKDHIVEDVVVNNIDIAGSTVSGTAEPSAELRVIVWSSPNHDSLTLTADVAGNWAANFSSIYQFTAATNGAVFQCDVDDDCTVVQWNAAAANDSDGDGLSDDDEINVHGTDPNNSDSDGDGLRDGDEVNVHYTNPNNPDSDGDGINDGVEVAAGSDPNVSSSVPTYMVDDFYEDTLDPAKWQRYEFIRRIKDGKLESAITRYDAPGSNNLLFTNPAEVISFQADVSVIDVSEDDFNPKARLTGSFFNDGTTGDGQTGDILIEFSIRDTDNDASNGLSGYYWIGRCENADCTDVDIPVFEAPAGWDSVALGDSVTMKLSYSQAVNSFTLNFGSQNLVVTSPFPNAGPAADPYKLIGTRVSNIVTGESGFIHAMFDNVYKNEAVEVYDDFQTAMIDSSRWYPWEFVRRANNGVLESAIARYDSNDGNHLTFISPHTIRGYQADVTVINYENNGSFPTARLAGAFYNDGTLGLEWTGDIIAGLGIAHNGSKLVSYYAVNRCRGDCNLQGNWDNLIYEEDFIPIQLGETYRLSIVWDEITHLFTFRFDDFTASYDPTVLAPMATGPRLEFNGIGTRVSGIGAPGEWGYIEARFDNVVVLNQVEEIDSDGDGIRDPIDNCPDDPNSDQANADNDIFGDVCDTCPKDADNDVDSDGVCGDVDNCPLLSNVDQTDGDHDGTGDVCDLDNDNDGVVDSVDNCSATFNPNQEDYDEDGVGEACDNCPRVANANQEDSDSDGMGNACEAGDGFLETLEVVDTDPEQPGEPLPKQPGEPLWVTATFENSSPEPVETIKPDCFNTSFHVTDSDGNTLPPRYRIRAAYGIPKDVVTLPPGPFSVTCDLANMFPPEILKDPFPVDGEPEPYTVVATYSNDIQDPDLNPVTGECANEPCSDLFVGAVSSPAATVKIEGTALETRTAECSLSPNEWNWQWTMVNGPSITASIANIKDAGGNTIDVGTVDPATIRLNGMVEIIAGSDRIENGTLKVQFDGSFAVTSMGNGLPGEVMASIQGKFRQGEAVFSGQVPVYMLYPIDIKPGSYPNSINLKSKGTVPVAILSTPDFEAAMVDPTTVTLAGAPVKLKNKGTPMASLEHVNGDGYQDLVVHIDTKQLNLNEGDTLAYLEGQTYDDPPTPIKGVDTVNIVPK
jgi:hypothetical protein